MKFHRDGTLPQNGEVFVFGSNLAGIHGAGAAKAAFDLFGAKWGEASGFTGKCYAIPTKDARINTLLLVSVSRFILDFVEVTESYPEMQWFVTRVGCGLAGFTDRDIAHLFKGAKNCSFAEQWKEYLNG